MYQASAAGPDTTALTRLFLGHYLRMYHENLHLEKLVLQSLCRGSLPLDVAFFVYQRMRELKADAKAAQTAGRVSVEGHVKFNALKARAEGLALAARERQVELWQELSASAPSLKALNDTGSALLAKTDECVACFEAMLRLNPTSVPALRQYAHFLEEVP